MLITPAQLVEEPLQLNETLAEGVIDYAPDIRQTGPLRITGQAELLLERRSDERGHAAIVQDIRLRARVEGSFTQLCARCLDPVPQPLATSLDLIFRPAEADADSAERAITEDETEIGYYEKSGLLLEDAVREQVLLTLPGRGLCQPDCKGLCPHCGVNRNLAACGCVARPVDPRLAPLAGLAAAIKA